MPESEGMLGDTCLSLLELHFCHSWKGFSYILPCTSTPWGEGVCTIASPIL